MIIFLLIVCVLLLCCYGILVMIRDESPGASLLGFWGIFGFGYYFLPLVFFKESGLNYVEATDLNEVVLMICLMYVSIYTGYYFTSKSVFAKNIFRFNLKLSLDGYIEKNELSIYIVALFSWTYYLATTDITVYQAEDKDLYLFARSEYSGIFSFLGSGSLNIIVILFISRVIKFGWRASIYFGVPIVLSFFYLFGTGQRMAILNPAIVFIGILFLIGWRGLAFKVIGLCVAFLLFVSPVMVAIREAGVATAGGDVIAQFSVYMDLMGLSWDKSLDSIIKRADAIAVAVDLKNYFDEVGRPGVVYFESILGAFVPKFIWINKPYPLSSTGDIFGEISVIAWHLANYSSSDTVGSLTAFGSIVAYREGGWWWIPFNGFLLGGAIVLFGNFFYGSNYFGKYIFASIYSVMAIKNVPPSLFHALIFSSSSVVLLLSVVAVDRFFYTVPKNR